MAEVIMPPGWIPPDLPLGKWLSMTPEEQQAYYRAWLERQKEERKKETHEEHYIPRWTKEEIRELLMTMDESSMNLWETYVNLATLKPPENPIFRFFWSIGVIAELLVSTVTFPAAMGAFMMEEATQASGMGAYMIAQTEDPNLLRQYMDRHMDFVAMAYTAVKTLSTINPVSGGAILRYMYAAVQSAEAFYDYADYLEIKQRAEEEKRRQREREEKRKATLAQLRITSAPEDAEIIIDGRNTGLLTPETFYDMEPGTYKIRLRKYNRNLELYEYGTAEVTLGAGEKREIRIVLEKKSKPEEEKQAEQVKSELRIESSPSSAEIWIDGINTNLLTPETIKGITPGTHTIRVRKYVRREDVWIEKEQKIDIGAKEKKEILIVLPPTPEEKAKQEMEPTGDLTITSTPPNAKIYIDNIDTNLITPETFYDIPEGEHEIRLEYRSEETGETYTTKAKTMVKPRRRNTIHIKIPTETPAETTTEETTMTPATLTINSTPTNANIILNGIETGYKTPITFTPITPNDYEIICYKEQPETGEILVGVEYTKIEPGETKEVKITLTPSG